MPPKLTAHLKNIRLVAIPDDDPDLSWIGEYSNTPGDADKTVDRAVVYNWSTMSRARDEYRYFIAQMSGMESGNPESVMQDFKRMEAYHRGAWQCLGLKAEAIVVVENDKGWSIVQKLTSGGIWGLESDYNKTDVQEIEREELGNLQAILEAFGFSNEEVKKAIDAAERKDYHYFTQYSKA